MVDVAASGRIPAARNEEKRQYLQGRLVHMSRLMFWSFVVLLAFIFVVYALYPQVEPRLNHYVYALSALGLAMLIGQWILLLRRELTLRQLEWVDVLYTVGTGTIFGASGALAYDLRSSAYICLTYACLLIVMRALVVPSTGKRTAVISIITCTPMTLATIGLGIWIDQDVPGPAYVGGGVLIFVMAILLATNGSQILYGLRRDADAVKQLKQLGQYTLDEKIGEGAFGAVYRARHALLRRDTAIKIVKKNRVDVETLDRFEMEVRNMSRLTHPNTVAVFDYGRSLEGVFYYAMEYLGGIDLEKLVRQFGAQPASRVVNILTQICGALSEAHDKGLTHRDVKPGNIILCTRGGIPDVTKVVDFGLAKDVDIEEASSAGVKGTLGYIAPEAITEPHRVGPAADLYAVGAVAYFLLTGRRVFVGADMMVKHLTEPPAPPSEHVPSVPPALDELVLRCLAKRIEDRPASAMAVAEALQQLAIADGWTVDAARAWWRDFECSKPAPVTIDCSTITIDVRRVA